MPNDRPTDAYRCGQLYAALAELEKLSAPGRKPSLGEPGARAKASKNPHGSLHRHLARVVEYVMAAQAQRQGSTAALIFQSIPELLPRAKELPRSFGDIQQEEFCHGWHAQVKALEVHSAAG
jgi:hypothetical protein